MGKVMVELSMSLDGFIAGPNDGPENPLGDGGEHLFRWYSSGDTLFSWPSGMMTSKVPAASAARFREMLPSIGALVTGRRTFDITHGWEGKHPMNIPVVVMTHSVPKEWAGKDSIFTFVSDGIEAAIAQAKKIAGDKDVVVGTASVTQQCLRAGLLDEIHIDLAPVLLGGGVRLFDVFGNGPVELERTDVVRAPGVTHLSFRVVKQ